MTNYSINKCHLRTDCLCEKESYESFYKKKQATAIIWIVIPQE